MTVVRVSQQELDRLKFLMELGDGHLGIDAATALQGLDDLSFPTPRKRSKAKVPRTWCRASAGAPAIAPTARRCARWRSAWSNQGPGALLQLFR